MKRRMFWRRCQKRRKRAFIKYFPSYPLRRQGVAVNAGSGLYVQALVSHDIELFLSAIQITGKTEELEQENAGRHVGRSGFHVLGYPFDRAGKSPLVLYVFSASHGRPIIQ